MHEPFTITDDILATKAQRFGNFIIDTIIYYLLTYILFFCIGAIEVLVFDSSAVGDYFATMGKLGEYVLGFVIIVVYYSLTEGLLGRSLAKYITNTVVVGADGERVGMGTIIKRSCCRAIPFEPLSFLGRRGWHDSLSDTYVVKKAGLDLKKHLLLEFDDLGREAQEA